MVPRSRTRKIGVIASPKQWAHPKNVFCKTVHKPLSWVVWTRFSLSGSCFAPETFCSGNLCPFDLVRLFTKVATGESVNFVEFTFQTSSLVLQRPRSGLCGRSDQSRVMKLHYTCQLNMLAMILSRFQRKSFRGCLHGVGRKEGGLEAGTACCALQQRPPNSEERE